MRKAKPRQLQPMICVKCGQDGVGQGETINHGVKRCTRQSNRPDYCPLCHEEFYTVREQTMKVTNFKAMKERAAAGEQGDVMRETKDLLVRTKWAAKKIYKHLIEHRRNNDTPESFFGSAE